MEIAAATIAYGLVAVVLSWPLVLHPGRLVWGRSHNDHTSLAFTLELVAQRLAAGQLPWGHTTRMEAPHGTTLFPADLLEAILIAPLTLAAGGWVAHAALSLAHVLAHEPGLTRAEVEGRGQAVSF